MSRLYVLLSMLTLTSTINYTYADTCDYQQSVIADFASRDSLPEYTNPNYRDSWGPKPATYPQPEIPAGCNRILWQQQRIIAVAKKYIGLPYAHHHIPEFSNINGSGLDCSNFTAWVYNYALGIRFSSDISKQATTAGYQLNPSDTLQPGDLLFIRTLDDSRISHVVIYIDSGHIIDDHASGVKIREFKGWYKNHFAYARRVIN